MIDLSALDGAIIDHIQSHKSHPLSSPEVRGFARQYLRLVSQREPDSLIMSRMKVMRDNGRISYKRLGKRYIVNPDPSQSAP